MRKELLITALLSLILFLVFRIVIFGGTWSDDIALALYDSYFIFTPPFVTAWLSGIMLFIFYWIRSGRFAYRRKEVNWILLVLSGLVLLFHSLAFIFLFRNGLKEILGFVLFFVGAGLGSLLFISWKNRSIG